LYLSHEPTELSKNFSNENISRLIFYKKGLLCFLTKLQQNIAIQRQSCEYVVYSGRTERKIAGHQKENAKNKENFKFNFFAFIIINYRSSDS